MRVHVLRWPVWWAWQQHSSPSLSKILEGVLARVWFRFCPITHISSSYSYEFKECMNYSCRLPLGLALLCGIHHDLHGIDLKKCNFWNCIFCGGFSCVLHPKIEELKALYSSGGIWESIPMKSSFIFFLITPFFKAHIFVGFVKRYQNCSKTNTKWLTLLDLML